MTEGSCPSCRNALLPPVPPPGLVSVCPACGESSLRARVQVGDASGALAGYRLLVLHLPESFTRRFSFESLLGSGFSGIVVRARDRSLQRAVAIKLLATPEDAEILLRFEREGRMAARLTHPNLVKLFDTGVLGDHPYLVYELLEGGTLASRMLGGGRLPPAEAVDLSLDVLAGLSACHGAGLIHRDIKPANLLFGEQRQLKIGDLGLAYSMLSRERLTRTGVAVGTPHYMAPEVFRGEEAGVAVDLYAVGLVLWEMLAGRRILEGADWAQIMYRKVAGEMPDPNDLPVEVPSGLRAVVKRAMASSPLERPVSAEELISLLEPYGSRGRSRVTPITGRMGGGASGPVNAAGPEGAGGRAGRWRPYGLVAALAGGVVLGAALGPLRESLRAGVPAVQGMGGGPGPAGRPPAPGEHAPAERRGEPEGSEAQEDPGKPDEPAGREGPRSPGADPSGPREAASPSPASAPPAVSPPAGVTRVTYATELLQSLRPDEALACIGEQAQHVPRTPEALALAGQIYLALRRGTDAERAFRRALEVPAGIGTGHIDALGHYARYLVAMGRRQEARALMEKALGRFDPFSLDTMATESWMPYESLRFALGELELAEGRIEAAAAVYREVWSPTNDRTFWVWMWREGAWGRALAADAVRDRLVYLEGRLKNPTSRPPWPIGPLPASPR